MNHDEEEQRIREWMKTAVVPEWIAPHIKQPEQANTLHYDETLEKVVYTSNKGKMLYFNSTEEAHDDDRIDKHNTELIGEFPDLLPDRDFGQTTKKNRLLFFGTNDKDYEMFLYKIYLCESSEKRYEKNPDDFVQSSHFISSHMLNWRVDDKPILDYWFEDNSHISKKALIDGQEHIWEAGTAVMEKTTMTEQNHFATGNTIEAAIIKLAAEIYKTYTWEGNFRK